MKQKLYTSAALMIGIIVVINLVSNEFHLRLDLTKEGQYTLSQATKDIIKDLDEPVTIKAYFSNDLPPDVIKMKRDFQDLLVEYANMSDGMIAFEFINPNEKEEYEKQALENGIQPVLIDVRDKDQMKQQKAFLGARISVGDKHESIPVIQPGSAIEYALSTAIKKVTVSEKPVVGFLQGHAEAPLAELIEASQQLDIQYQAQEITLSDSVGIPDEIQTIAIIRPQDSIPVAQLFKLEQFISRGGRLFLGLNRVQGDLRSKNGFPINSSLVDWLRSKGIVIEDNFVIDAQCGSISVPEQMGPFTVQRNISFPYIPVIRTFSDHPITAGLEAMLLEFASSISYTGDSTIRFTPIAFSSEKSNSLKAPQFFDLQKEWTESDFTMQHIPVAATIEGKTFKMVIVTDGDFVINGPQQQARRVQPDNVSFLVNSIDWLSDDTGLIALRTKGASMRPLDKLDDTTRAIVKYGNFLLPILLAVGYGIFRAQRNRSKRWKRMNENYEAA